jgi:hypothetical protein
MKYRNVELYFEQSLDDEGTKIIDLHTADPISAIRLNFRGTNGSGSNKDHRLDDVITKIELVDGSDQLLSLSLKELLALQFRRTGRIGRYRPAEGVSQVSDMTGLILFGRYLWDKEYYMDLTKFRNPQLKITSSLAASGGVATTAWATGSLKVTIDLHIMEEGAEPAKGFMMAKNIRGFTSATSGDEPTPLPKDHPYVGLMVRAYTLGNDVDENISRLKINCDSGKFTPIDKKVLDLYRRERDDFGDAIVDYIIFRKLDDVVTHPINHDPIITLVCAHRQYVATADYSYSGRFPIRVDDVAGNGITSETDIYMTVRGGCPFSTVHLPFGLRNEPDSYFDPSLYDDIELVLTQAAASAVSIILEQLRPY